VGLIKRWQIERSNTLGLINNICEVKDGAIDSTKLADLAVTTAKLADSAVTSVKLADGSVTSAKIVNGAVTTDKISNLAVTSAKIAGSAVTTDKIANLAVTNAKLADGSVTSAKIANGNVTTSKIADLAVTTAKIANGAVTLSKLGQKQTDAGFVWIGSLKSTSSTSKTTLESLTVNMARDGVLIVIANVKWSSNPAGLQAEFTLTCDGTDYSWSSDYTHVARTDGYDTTTAIINGWDRGGGSHTVELGWRIQTGTGTIYSKERQIATLVIYNVG